MNVLRIALLLLAIFSVHLVCDAKIRDRNFCRKYPFAPRCRGAGAKRDLQKLEPLLEEPRARAYHNGEKLNSEYDINDQRLLDTFISKVNPRVPEETMDDYM